MERFCKEFFKFSTKCLWNLDAKQWIMKSSTTINNLLLGILDIINSMLVIMFWCTFPLSKISIYILVIRNQLTWVFLSNCQLSGQLMSSQLLQFKDLLQLDLRNNSICGHIPESLGELSSLRSLHLSNNKLNGTLSEIHFANLTNLWFFSASENSLALKFQKWLIDNLSSFDNDFEK